MKIVTPILLAVLGLGAGVGAGIALKPPAEEPAVVACVDAAATPPAADAGHDSGQGAGHAAAPEAEASYDAPPCPAPDPFAHAEPPAKDDHGVERAYVTMDKPFVVPVFAGEKVVAMVVVSLSVETETEAAQAVEDVKPRLRDSFLNAMFRHANSGGFDGSFTSGRKLEDLKSALLEAAHEVLVKTPVDEVLITEIARQDV